MRETTGEEKEKAAEREREPWEKHEVEGSEEELSLRWKREGGKVGVRVVRRQEMKAEKPRGSE